VTHIFTEHKGRRALSIVGERDRFMPEFKLSLAVPLEQHNGPSLADHLERVGLGRDARNLWVGYPNLQQSIFKLLEWIGPQWPSQNDAAIPAVFYAAEQAILAVKGGIEREESDRRYVIANFHNGLASLAAELESFAAWGCTEMRAIAQFRPFEERFDAWCESGGFDRVIFSPKNGNQSTEHVGLIWKMRACVSPNRDIGLIHKYGER